MAVNCSLIYKEEESPRKNFGCFGFMPSLNVSKGYPWDIFYGAGVDTCDFKQITAMRYFPVEGTINVTPNMEKVILALEKLGANKVIQYLDPDAGTPAKRMASGLTADVTKFSAPMFTGAFELYRMVARGGNIVNNIAYLLDNKVAPKIAVFLPVFFAGNQIGNSAMNTSLFEPGYGSFDVWTTRHLKNDGFPVARDKMEYRGIHKCYQLPVHRKFKLPLKDIPGSVKYRNILPSEYSSPDAYMAESQRRHKVCIRFTKQDLLGVCRKMQNGSL